MVSTVELAVTLAEARRIGFMCAIQSDRKLDQLEEEIKKAKDQEEYIIYPNLKQLILETEYHGTDYMLMAMGNPVRALRTKRVQYLLELERKEGAKVLIRFFKEYCKNRGFGGQTEMNTGDIDNGILPLGMISGRKNEIKPVKAIVDDIVREANDVLTKFVKRTSINYG